MKKLLVLLVFCCMLFQCLAHFSVIGLYELRKDYVARNLCVNRNKPQLKCCGKCYLQKQLSKVDDRSNNAKNTPVKTEKQEITAYLLPSVIQFSRSRVPVANSLFYPAMQHMKTRLLVSTIFRPPSVCQDIYLEIS